LPATTASNPPTKGWKETKETYPGGVEVAQAMEKGQYLCAKQGSDGTNGIAAVHGFEKAEKCIDGRNKTWRGERRQRWEFKDVVFC
jgi:hypothetical protein